MIWNGELFYGQSVMYKTPLNTSEASKDNMNFYYNTVLKSEIAYQLGILHFMAISNTTPSNEIRMQDMV